MKNVLFVIMMLGLFACSSKTAQNAAKTPEGKMLMEQKTTYEKIPWVGIDEAETLAKAKPRRLLVDVYTDWCGPCKMMDRMTFIDQTIIDQVSKNFYPVKFNAEGPETFNFMGKEYGNPNHVPNKKGRNAKHQLAGYFGVPGYPTLVILDENMQVVGKLVGYKTPEMLTTELQQYIASN